MLLVAIVSFGLLLSNKNLSHSSDTVPIIPNNLVRVDPHQLACVAKNIFYEAKGESIIGQAAIAHVVLNRVAHGFAGTPCKVIYQKTVVEDKVICQFSWVCSDHREPNKNDRKYKVAQQVAYDVMIHDRYNDVVPKSTLFFHNLSVNPSWPYKQVAQIGNHIFYSKTKKPTQKIIAKSEK